MSVSKEMQNRKRKLEDCETEEKEEEIKKFIESSEEKPGLLDLADEIILVIMYKLDGESLHNLGL